MAGINKGSLLAIVFVSILAVSAFFFKGEVMACMRLALEGGYLKSLSVVAVAIIVFSHSIKVRPGGDSSGVMIRSGLVPLDVSLTLGTYITVSTTACSLLEGAFVQNFYGVEYFSKFDELDIYVLLGVAALLLWYVAFHMYKMVVELLFNVESVSSATGAAHEG